MTLCQRVSRLNVSLDYFSNYEEMLDFVDYMASEQDSEDLFGIPEKYIEILKRIELDSKVE